MVGSILPVPIRDLYIIQTGSSTHIREESNATYNSNQYNLRSMFKLGKDITPCRGFTSAASQTSRTTPVSSSPFGKSKQHNTFTVNTIALSLKYAWYLQCHEKVILGSIITFLFNSLYDQFSKCRQLKVYKRPG